jgi:hypothetical protein
MVAIMAAPAPSEARAAMGTGYSALALERSVTLLAG